MVVHPVEHLRHPTEMPAAVHGEEEEHRTLGSKSEQRNVDIKCVLRSSHVEGISHLALPFPPGRVQSLVAMLCAAPNLVSGIFLLGIYGLKRYEVLKRASEVGWLGSVLETFHFPQ